jgi:hypothetical protein
MRVEITVNSTSFVYRLPEVLSRTPVRSVVGLLRAEGFDPRNVTVANICKDGCQYSILDDIARGLAAEAAGEDRRVLPAFYVGLNIYPDGSSVHNRSKSMS